MKEKEYGKKTDKWITRWAEGKGIEKKEEWNNKSKERTKMQTNEWIND